jgi:hypothetical protein
MRGEAAPARGLGWLSSESLKTTVDSYCRLLLRLTTENCTKKNDRHRPDDTDISRVVKGPADRVDTEKQNFRTTPDRAAKKKTAVHQQGCRMLNVAHST